MRVKPSRRLAVLPLVLAAFAAAGWLFMQRTDERRLIEARELVAAGRPADGRAKAHEVTSGPVLGRAAAVAGFAAAQTGDLPGAVEDLRRAARRRPNDWRVRREYAAVLLLSGRRTAARRQMNRALELNPRAPLPLGFRFRESGP